MMYFLKITKTYKFFHAQNKTLEQAAMKPWPRSREHRDTSCVNHKAYRLLKCSDFYAIFDEATR